MIVCRLRGSCVNPYFLQAIGSEVSCSYFNLIIQHPHHYKKSYPVTCAKNKDPYYALGFRDQCTERFVGSSHLFSNRSRCYSQCAESYSSLNLSNLERHWFKNWQELRKHKLTASTFASAIGFWHRRRTQLWLEKVGAIKPFSGNFATWWSNMKEEEALERYILLTRNDVLLPEFQVYNSGPEDDWLGASPDGIVSGQVYELPSKGVLEIKCPYVGGDKTRNFPYSRIPLYCIPQAQGLMEIMGKDWMHLYIWTPNGSSLFMLYRDPEYWDVLKIALSDFWWKHVQPAKEICRNRVITNHLVELKSFRPAPRHELCSHIVCISKQIVDTSDLVVREIHGNRTH